MLPLLRAIRTMFAYVLTLLKIVNTPLPFDNYVTLGGIYLLAAGALAIFGNSYGFNIWYQLDVMVNTICHNTRYRTISSWTGERLHIPRYRIQAKVIDTLAITLGDKPRHCERMYLWEKKMGFIEQEK